MHRSRGKKEWIGTLNGIRRKSLGLWITGKDNTALQSRFRRLGAEEFFVSGNSFVFAHGRENILGELWVAPGIIVGNTGGIIL